jgi:ABC-type branched-subunit amino acid transport system permease subunit
LFPWLADALGLSYYIGLVRRVMIFAIAAASLNFIMGFGGMVSLGHAAFFGAHAEVQRGHSHREAVGDLAEDDAAGAVGDFAGDLYAAIHRAGVHNDRAVLHFGGAFAGEALFQFWSEGGENLLAQLHRVHFSTGAGGLGQMLKYHLSLFQIQQAASVIIAMLALVCAVVEVAPWSRIPETRALVVPRDV